MFFSDGGTFGLGVGLGCAGCAAGDTTTGVWQVIFGSTGKETIRSLKERNFGLGFEVKKAIALLQERYG